MFKSSHLMQTKAYTMPNQSELQGMFRILVNRCKMYIGIFSTWQDQSVAQTLTPPKNWNCILLQTVWRERTSFHSLMKSTYINIYWHFNDLIILTEKKLPIHICTCICIEYVNKWGEWIWKTSTSSQYRMVKKGSFWRKQHINFMANMP